MIERSYHRCTGVLSFNSLKLVVDFSKKLWIQTDLLGIIILGTLQLRLTFFYPSIKGKGRNVLMNFDNYIFILKINLLLAGKADRVSNLLRESAVAQW